MSKCSSREKLFDVGTLNMMKVPTQNHNYPPIIIFPPRIMMAATTQGSSNGVSCPHCNKLSLSINHPTKYNWSESWKCTDEACPLGIFYSCRDCYRNNKLNATAKFLSNKKSLYGHHRTKHSSSPPPPKQARVSIEHEEGTSSHFHADDDEAMTYPSESSPSSPSPFASQAILTEHLGSYSSMSFYFLIFT
jgi:hypothetical protein